MALDLDDINKPSRTRVKRNPFKKVTLAPWEKPDTPANTPPELVVSTETTETRNKPVMAESSLVEFQPRPILTSDSVLQETRNKPVMGKIDLLPSGMAFQEETRNKPVINPKQTRNKGVINPEQTRNKPVTETRNKMAKGSEETQVSSLTRNKPVTKPVTNPEQTRNKITPEFPHDFENSYATATKCHREILNLIYNEIRETLDNITPPMNLEELGQKLSRSGVRELESLRIIVLRLEKMGLILRSRIKSGRGGWTQYSLPKSIFIQIRESRLSNKPVTNPELTRNKPVSQTVIEASSISSFNINTNNTSQDQNWDIIQIPPVLKQFNFGQHIVKQVRDRQLLAPAELQDSLNAFAFDVMENDLIAKKKIYDPIRYFMGITNKKMQYAPAGNFLSDEDKAFEENKKRLEAIKQRRVESERIEAELAFEEWISSLSKEEKISLVPENVFRVGTAFHTQMLKAHFEEILKKGPVTDNPS